MKTILSRSILSFLAIALMVPVWAGTLEGEQKNKNKNKEDDSFATETRTVEPFSEIELTCVGNIRFTQSDTYSLRLEGTAHYVETVQTNVKGEKLVIECKESNNKKRIEMTVYISAPSLNAVNIKGVGDFTNEGALRCDKLSLRLDGVGNYNVSKLKADKVTLRLGGVGNMDVDLECDNLHARMDGVGQMTLSGRTRVADIRRGGIGSLNRKGLQVTESK